MTLMYMLIGPFILMWVLIAWLKYREHLHANRDREEQALRPPTNRKKRLITQPPVE